MKVRKSNGILSVRINLFKISAHALTKCRSNSQSTAVYFMLFFDGFIFIVFYIRPYIPKVSISYKQRPYWINQRIPASPSWASRKAPIQPGSLRRTRERRRVRRRPSTWATGCHQPCPWTPGPWWNSKRGRGSQWNCTEAERRSRTSARGWQDR